MTKIKKSRSSRVGVLRQHLARILAGGQLLLWVDAHDVAVVKRGRTYSVWQAQPCGKFSLLGQHADRAREAFIHPPEVLSLDDHVAVARLVWEMMRAELRAESSGLLETIAPDSLRIWCQYTDDRALAHDVRVRLPWGHALHATDATPTDAVDGLRAQVADAVARRDRAAAHVRQVDVALAGGLYAQAASEVQLALGACSEVLGSAFHASRITRALALASQGELTPVHTSLGGGLRAQLDCGAPGYRLLTLSLSAPSDDLVLAVNTFNAAVELAGEVHA